MSGDGFKTYRGSVGPARVGKSHQKDPRLIRPVSGSSDQAADIRQLVDVKKDLREGFISQHDARTEYRDNVRNSNGLKNLPVQLTFTPFPVLLSSLTAGAPRLLVPHNPHRYGLIVAYSFNATTGAVSYSFGTPVQINPNSIGIQIPAGAAGTTFYVNQACPIDDVWVNIAAANNGFICVYEGTIALEGNQI